MEKETLNYLQNWITSPYSQEVENLSSLSHETLGIPDTYLFFVDNEGLKTPKGKLVKMEIEKDTALEKREYQFVLAFEDWVKQNSQGKLIWFSPSYTGVYPEVKITISEIVYDLNFKKVILNRAFCLSINNKTCLDLANQFSHQYTFQDPEELRQTPLVITENEVLRFLDALSVLTEQIGYLQKDGDIKIKADTYQKMEQIERSVSSLNCNYSFPEEFELARKQGLIGEHQPSCPFVSPNSQHILFSREMPIHSEVRYYKCICPSCHTEVTATIVNGVIHCPNCGASASCSC